MVVRDDPHHHVPPAPDMGKVEAELARQLGVVPDAGMPDEPYLIPERVVEESIKVRDVNLLKASLMSEFYDDPLGYVLTCFEWNKPGTFVEGKFGPDKWQTEFLLELGKQVRERGFNGVDAVDAIQMSVSSGHGIGKTTAVAWLIKWIMDTRPFCKGALTANTKDQLKSKTWAELIKWNAISLTADWWDITHGDNMSMKHCHYKTQWQLMAMTCDKENSEAFAGQHAASSTSFYIFDEASNIPEEFFAVREGGLTDGEPMTFDFGNPTRSSGRFYENMVGKYKDEYTKYFIDSRESGITNQRYLAGKIRQYGIDSDWVKVRIRGMFPSQSTWQFIATHLVEWGMAEPDKPASPYDPVIIGVDVATEGNDESCIVIRRGRDCREPDYTGQISNWEMRDRDDTMLLAERVAVIAKTLQADAVVVDKTGVGAGTYDRLMQLNVRNVIGIHGSESPIDTRQYANRRAECWGNMRDALYDGLYLPPEDEELKAQLIGLLYEELPNKRIQLESKKALKARGQPSPDKADALAYTFAVPFDLQREGYMESSVGRYESQESGDYSHDGDDY